MILSPLPAHQRKRHFHLFHGELIEEDDHDEDDHDDEDGDYDESSEISLDDDEVQDSAELERQSATSAAGDQ